jgi:hypothetical protein
VRARAVVVVGLPAIVAGLLVLPAAGAAEEATIAALLPAGQVRLVDGELRSTSSVREVLLDGVRPADRRSATAPLAQPQALLGAAAVAVETSGGGETVSTSALVGGHDVDTASAGDLDGDGRDDVVVLISQLSSAVLQAVSGADGRVLWSRRPADDSFAFVTAAGRDLTGDGVPDLVLNAFADVAYEREEEGPDGQVFKTTVSFDQRYAVLSGRDGSPAWQRSVEGSVVETRSESGDHLGGYSDEYRYTVTDGIVLPLVVEDPTGDDAADVALSVVDLEYVERYEQRRVLVAGQSRFDETFTSGTDAALLDGRTGDAVAERRVAEQTGISLLLPAGDLDDDGQPELLWTTEPEDQYSSRCLHVADRNLCENTQPTPLAASLELLRGKDLSVLWSSRATGRYLFPLRLGTDVDGDGTADLATYAAEPGWTVSVLSGADGRALWSSFEEDAVAFLTGVSTGTAGPVATLTRFDTGTTAQGEVFLEAATERRTAGTGLPLSRTARRATAAPPQGGDSFGSAFGSIWFTPDADGDGAPELLTDLSVSVGTIGRSGAVVSSLLVVEDHATARVVRSTEDADQRQVQPFGDLDGDGLLDVRTDRYDQDDEGFPGSDVALARAADGAPLWELHLSGDDSAGLSADHDGDRGGEVLVVRATDEGVRLDDRSGRDGHVRWSNRLPGPHDQ